MQEIKLGTSGWSYRHWKNVFYPPALPQKQWFEFFTRRFDTVELNAPFYRIPGANAIASWNAHTPAHFRFSIKMNRQITHIKKLHNCEVELDRFFKAFTQLNNKISVILIQLPPNLRFNYSRLEEFISLLPDNKTCAFEFRHPSWYNKETFALLKKNNCAFCIHDMPGLVTPRTITSDLIYIRFHGYDTLYGGNYPDAALENWAAWIEVYFKEGKSIFAYFNNDLGGLAVQNCLTLKNMIRST